MQIAYNSNLHNASYFMRPLTTVCNNYALYQVDSNLKATSDIMVFMTLAGQLLFNHNLSSLWRCTGMVGPSFATE
ncbi:hypothetical protein K470DRAFT_260959 [Piedraia hortae CBS 480.64]|uniref:Uncharacterized protein n=1 Tax=Piedraia hortae CBS 480.64 TaxID=1314780 RepID=A0A6A7BRA7_9PEZI|nr:hypothetical protein K470DRAFT_260959 [Piedraia hortae CBS 480.64]